MIHTYSAIPVTKKIMDIAQALIDAPPSDANTKEVMIAFGIAVGHAIKFAYATPESRELAIDSFRSVLRQYLEFEPPVDVAKLRGEGTVQ